MRILFIFLLIISFHTSCNPLGNDGAAKDSTTIATPSNEPDEVRLNLKATPVAAYEKRTLNDLNEWYFRVQLYETKRRFVYNLKMQYEEINEEKEVLFPNLKIEPQPQVRKGAKDFEAVVGFLDNKGAFKEFLLVSAEGGNLKLKTLKNYAVRSK